MAEDKGLADRLRMPLPAAGGRKHGFSKSRTCTAAKPGNGREHGGLQDAIRALFTSQQVFQTVSDVLVTVALHFRNLRLNF
jgi:hypothetical protein